MKLVNLTPHGVTLRNSAGVDTIVPPSGTIARVSSTPGLPEQVEGVPVPVFGRETFGEVTGLPAPEDGAVFIVSLLVAQATRGTRLDVVRPGTGLNDGAIRDEAGQIQAVTRLVRA